MARDFRKPNVYSGFQLICRNRNNLASSNLRRRFRPFAGFCRFFLFNDTRNDTRSGRSLADREILSPASIMSNRRCRSLIPWPIAVTLSLSVVTHGQSGQGKARIVAIDEGHNNFHRLGGSYGTLAKVLTNEEFSVRPFTAVVTPESLREISVLITANPQPEPRPVLLQKATAANEQFQWSAAARQSAYTTTEIATIEAWVRGGGGLLLVLDHPPFGGSGGLLAAAFGIESRNAQTTDPLHQENGIAGRLVFNRGDAAIGDHPTTVGVERVVTFLGTSLSGPPGSTALLKLFPTAIDREYQSDKGEFAERSAATRAQALALAHGRGRVVVLAEAGLLASEPGSNQPGDGTNGLLRKDLSTARFAVNIMRWLAGDSFPEASP